MDHILALNTAEGLLQFVIVRLDESGPVTLTAQAWHAPSQGAELLAPAIESALHRLHLAPGQITRICVVRGPGSFTGLRLAIATASGLRRATGALCAGLDYLPLLAHSAALLLGCGQGDAPERSAAPLVLWTLTHARRDLLHAQGFLTNEKDGTGLPVIEPLTDIVVCSPAQSAALIQERSPAGSEPCLLGSGVIKNRDALRAALAQEAEAETALMAPRLLPEAFAHPNPLSLASLAVSARYAAQDIEPLYVRASDAQDNLGSIAQTLHLDPDAAVQRMEELARHIPENPVE